MIRVQEWRGAGFVQITCTKFALENNIQFSWSSKICKCVNIWENRVSLSVAGGLGPVVRKWERETARESKSTSVCISFETHLFQREPCFWVLAFLGTVSELVLSLFLSVPPLPHILPRHPLLPGCCCREGEKLPNGNKTHTQPLSGELRESHDNMSHLNFTSNEKQ